MAYIHDIHTHHDNRKNAIINASIHGFTPQCDMLYSIGIHPWNINKSSHIDNDLQKIETLAAENAHIVAIGECGLDACIDVPLEKQIHILERHIIIAERLRKPLILHCVRRSAEILRLHNTYKPEMPWIMHGFRSNENVLNSILKHSGIYISIGEKFNADAVKLIPDNRILIETDESLLSINEICSKVAHSRSQSADYLLNQVILNTSALFL